MNRFDDAVRELVSGSPSTTGVDRLRARTRRRHRRRAAVVVALVAVIGAGSIGIAATLADHGGGPHIAVSPTTPAPSVDTTWCVAFSRDQALARGISYGTVIVSHPRARAKLVSRSELEVEGNPWAGTDARLAAHDAFWVVELRPAGRPDGPYTWGLVALDANRGDVVTANEGPGAEPPYWGALPDHGSECPSGVANATAPTTTTVGGSRACSIARDCLGNSPRPTAAPCPANQARPSFAGSFCGPVPGPGNGLGPSGECTGRETEPPCGPGMVSGRYYEYTLPGRCDGRLVVDGRRWLSQLPPPTPVPDMNVWVEVDGDHAGFISPSGSVGFDPDHGQPAHTCAAGP